MRSAHKLPNRSREDLNDIDQNTDGCCISGCYCSWHDRTGGCHTPYPDAFLTGDSRPDGSEFIEDITAMSNGEIEVEMFYAHLL